MDRDLRVPPHTPLINLKQNNIMQNVTEENKDGGFHWFLEGLSEPPEGCEWVPRGYGWKTDQPTMWISSEKRKDGSHMGGSLFKGYCAEGDPNQYYWEAVPKEMSPEEKAFWDELPDETPEERDQRRKDSLRRLVFCKDFLAKTVANMREAAGITHHVPSESVTGIIRRKCDNHEN